MVLVNKAFSHLPCIVGSIENKQWGLDAGNQVLWEETLDEQHEGQNQFGSEQISHLLSGEASSCTKYELKLKDKKLPMLDQGYLCTHVEGSVALPEIRMKKNDSYLQGRKKNRGTTNYILGMTFQCVLGVA